ncbi:hypothetical protein [Chryseobacterium sp. Leaf405]|uniref:hypothetical protein n=1 Tax=Chryseobacterium sp. Leaf405 TaxID=1736367 RepID=UPI00103D953C|nr:hypothetical protein [Chryseobacterium sp. Leaf405]
MKNISIPILFFLSVILQIISCYIFSGKNSEFSFFLISVLSSFTATFLAYALIYYFTFDSGEKRSTSDIKIGFTTCHYIIISVFVIFLFILPYNKLYENQTIGINGIILAIYGRQILNKELNNIKS